MKSSAPVSLQCRIVRGWSALRETPSSRHLQRCPACREYFARARTLETALQRESRAETFPVPFGLESQILRCVTAAAAPARRQRHTRAFARWERRDWMIGVSVGLAGALALAVWLSPGVRPSVEAEATPLAFTAQELAPLVDSAARLSDRWWNGIVPTTGQALQENPLQQEAASVYVAARSALDFLALNFLPATPSENLPPETPRSG